jgi:hypothetical protein
MFCRGGGLAAPNVCVGSRNGGAVERSVGPMTIKYYAHFLVDEPDTRVLQEYRGVVELDSTPSRGGELKEAALVIARNMGRKSRDVKVLQWARLH